MSGLGRDGIGVGEFQKFIEEIYFEKDKSRGLEGSFMWFAEEFGELTRALRRTHNRDNVTPEERENLLEEFADVLAWLSTLASIAGVDLEDAIRLKYGRGCPYCGSVPCACQH